jgi:cell division transport system ATP-binding protein
MIRFQNIAKYYGLRTLFEKLNIEISSGEMVALIGDSGVGKSTLIHMLLGAEIPNKGVVEIDGFDVSALGRRERQMLRRSIGFIFQDFKLLPQKTVFENVAFAMEVCGNSNDEIETRVPLVLRIVGLSHCEHRFPHQLSGGENQRVAIARALVHKPRLLVADEPTGNLDPPNALEIGKILERINQEDETTVIIATHDRDLVNYLKPRVIALKNGIVVSDKKRGQFALPAH